MVLVCMFGIVLVKGRLLEGYFVWYNEDLCDVECCEGDRFVMYMVWDIWLY